MVMNMQGNAAADIEPASEMHISMQIQYAKYNMPTARQRIALRERNEIGRKLLVISGRCGLPDRQIVSKPAGLLPVSGDGEEKSNYLMSAPYPGRPLVYQFAKNRAEPEGLLCRSMPPIRHFWPHCRRYRPAIAARYWLRMAARHCPISGSGASRQRKPLP